MNNNITLILGPMRAGKSTELLRRIQRCQAGANKTLKRVLVIIPERDTRCDAAQIVTHDRDRSAPALRTARLCDVLEQARQQSNTVFVDEVQFFAADDVYEFALKLCATHELVFVGLSGRFDLTPWPAVSVLLPLATDVHFLRAVCNRCGQEATTTHLKGDATQIGEDGVLINDSAYESLCLRCHRLATT